MILKIKFDKKNYDEAISKLHDLECFFYNNGYFYVSATTNQKKRIVKSDDECYLINSSMMETIPSDIRNWCRDIFIQEELRKYEKSKEGQKRLREIMKSLELREEALNEKG